RRGRRLPRAGRRVRAQVGREGDREGPPRHLGLRVGVPDEPAQPDAGARGRDDLRDGEPAGELRLLERREGDRGGRRGRDRAGPGAGRAPAGRGLPERTPRDARAPRRMIELDVTLRDGRTLHVYDHGEAGANVVVQHHGTPGSGLVYPPDVAQAGERGLRAITYDRAGYGGSTPNPGRSVADVVPDIEDVLDSLGVERYVS